ncbi:alkaline phosphatase family protein [Chondrinema litorale]|uniref:alkaline phosphatase family protein n=1 Tax=Chondrinema litorale TaxID=2994555 RepID=UPI002542BDB4|nr:nucleotide pyrophosphatase/phosphodiesterase family protein [Chondrinema litorale]UZR94178.1 alkaline phosphatase family protein [Chondrinema litorale]
MKKTVVINVVGLTSGLIGKHTPFLNEWKNKAKSAQIKPVLPAVTCSSQYTYLTGKWPSEHGIVGNGWYFRDECEIKLWRQSNHLVQANKVWEIAAEKNKDFTSANMFWWYNMYASVDYCVTPRPVYPSDGRKLPDIYSMPMDMREKLQKELGDFPLFNFWGPNSNIVCSKWIADASKIVEEWHSPTLTLIYLPHLDYNMQRYGKDDPRIHKDLEEIDEVCKDLITFYENKDAEVIVVSEYGITNVNKPININRIFRQKGYLSIKEDLGLEYLDAGTSKAFAVADHQIAHVYVNDKSKLAEVKSLLENTDGIELVLDEEGKKKYHIDHERSGELVVVADKDSWFTYYYWLDDKKAPDYARTVDIHRKPGYDPVELFLDPEIKVPLLKVGGILLKKKLGFRYLMDVIPLTPELVKGSHGRLTEDPEDQPIFISNKEGLEVDQSIEPVAVFDLILQHLFN